MTDNCNIIISDNNYNIMIIGDFSVYYNYDVTIPLLDQYLSDRQCKITLILDAYGHTNGKFLLRNISEFSYK